MHDLVNALCDQPRCCGQQRRNIMAYDAILAGLPKGIENQFGGNASRFDPELIEALAHAIAACEKSPLVPDSVPDLVRIIDDAQSLRNLARDIKGDLPFLLRTSSAERLSELSAKLWACASLAAEVAKSQSELARATRLLIKFDHQVIDLAAHADDMVADIS
jgi:hypothetical protein